jgi:hypothetical protein
MFSPRQKIDFLVNYLIRIFSSKQRHHTWYDNFILNFDDSVYIVVFLITTRIVFFNRAIN